MQVGPENAFSCIDASLAVSRESRCWKRVGSIGRDESTRLQKLILRWDWRAKCEVSWLTPSHSHNGSQPIVYKVWYIVFPIVNPLSRSRARGIIIMSSFDITTTRDRFPALNQPQVFFDNAGGSQTLGTVIDSWVTPPYWHTIFWCHGASQIISPKPMFKWAQPTL